MEASRRQVKSSVWERGDDPAAWAVAETPSEVAEIVREGRATGAAFVELTLANQSDWNGRTLYIDPHDVSSISPPMRAMRGDEVE